MSSLARRQSQRFRLAQIRLYATKPEQAAYNKNTSDLGEPRHAHAQSDDSSPCSGLAGSASQGRWTATSRSRRHEDRRSGVRNRRPSPIRRTPLPELRDQLLSRGSGASAANLHQQRRLGFGPGNEAATEPGTVSETGTGLCPHWSSHSQRIPRPGPSI